VEDSPTQRELIIDLLKGWLKSYGSYQWNGGVGKFSFLPDLVVLDVVMLELMATRFAVGLRLIKCTSGMCSSKGEEFDLLGHEARQTLT